MPEQRKRLHCVAEITLSTTFLLASEVPAIAAFARSGLHQKRNFKTHAPGYQKPMPDVLADRTIKKLCSFLMIDIALIVCAKNITLVRSSTSECEIDQGNETKCCISPLYCGTVLCWHDRFGVHELQRGR